MNGPAKERYMNDLRAVCHNAKITVFCVSLLFHFCPGHFAGFTFRFLLYLPPCFFVSSTCPLFFIVTQHQASVVALTTTLYTSHFHIGECNQSTLVHKTNPKKQRKKQNKTKNRSQPKKQRKHGPVLHRMTSSHHPFNTTNPRNN